MRAVPKLGTPWAPSGSRKGYVTAGRARYLTLELQGFTVSPCPGLGRKSRGMTQRV